MPTSSEPMRQRLTRKLKAAASQLWKQFRTLRRALVHPGVPWYAKAVCGCAVAYVASPIQLIPNFIPVIGQLDDVLVIGLSLRFLKRCCSASVLQDCQKDATGPAAPKIESGVSKPVSSDAPAEPPARGPSR
ncbi:MAG: YkvA family protein [Acidobacteriaceae bacterium]